MPKHLHQNNNSSIEADMKVEINKKRLEYLLALYKMSVDDLLSLLNKGRKRITGAADISGDSIDLGELKRIGEIFDKEVSFFQCKQQYLLPQDLIRNRAELGVDPYCKPIRESEKRFGCIQQTVATGCEV